MLELRGVDAGYGAFQALFDISLDVAAGEAVAVIGPNGAGKTTLMRVISGLIPASAGQITMEGRSVIDVRPHEVVGLGIAHAPENRRLFPRMTVEDNLRMGGFAKAARSRYRERLDFVYELFPRMKERRGQLAGTLSGGEQRIVVPSCSTVRSNVPMVYPMSPEAPTSAPVACQLRPNPGIDVRPSHAVRIASPSASGAPNGMKWAPSPKYERNASMSSTVSDQALSTVINATRSLSISTAGASAADSVAGGAQP